MKITIDKTRMGIILLALGVVMLAAGLILNELNQYKQISAMKAIVVKPVVKYVMVTPTATPTPTLVVKKGLGK